MNINQEAGNLSVHINNTVRHGFTAKVLADNSVRIEYSLGATTFDIVVVADSQHNVFVPDYCPIGMNNRPANFNHRQHLGYLFLALSEYNIKMNKRLSKDRSTNKTTLCNG